MSHAIRGALSAALGAACLTLVSATVQAHSDPSPRGPGAAPWAVLSSQDSLTATVRSVGESGIEVIRGVQYFLKITYVAVDSATVIVRDGQPASMEELGRGDLVTVHYRQTERGTVARRIVIRSRPDRSDIGDAAAGSGGER